MSYSVEILSYLNAENSNVLEAYPSNPSNFSSETHIGVELDINFISPPYRISGIFMGTFLDVSDTTPKVWITRQSSSTRTIRVTNEDSAYVQVTNVPQFQRIDGDYYSDYTYDSSGNIVVTPNFSGQTYDISTNPLYSIWDIQSGVVLANWTATPTFSISVLKDVEMRIRDDYGATYTTTIEYEALDTLSVIKDTDYLSITNNPMVAIYDSTISSGEIMRYKYKLYDKNGDEIITTSLYPDISNNNYGIYDMSMIYNNYVTTTPTLFDNYLFTSTSDIYNYSYNVNDQDITESTGITTSTKYCFKGATQYGDFFNEDEWIGNLGSNRKFLTDWVGDYLYRSDDYGTIRFTKGYFGSGSGGININAIRITKYNYGDTGVPSNDNPSRVLFIKNASNLIDNKIYNIPLAPKNINLAFQNNNVTDLFDNIVTTDFLNDDNIRYYTIDLVDVGTGVNTVQSETIKININTDEECLKYTPTTFMWLDNFGNYNTFTYNGMNIEERSFERNEINKNYYSYTSNNYTYSIGDRGRKNVNIKQTETHSVQSGWLDDNLSNNLMGLYASSDVYVIINDNIYPIIITSNRVINKNVVNNRLFNHEIEYKMAYDLNVNE